MYKAMIYLSIIFSVINFSFGKHRKKEKVKEQAISEWSDHLKFYSNISMDIRLYELPTWTQDGTENSTKSFTGIIEVIIPQASYTQFLCFPHSFAEFYQAYMFAHITCRRQGFMTLVAVGGEEFPNLLAESRYHGMKVDSYSCFDREQIISRCRWNAISIRSCQNVTKVTCGGCQNVAKGFSGIIRSPGFPYLYLKDVTCEWKVFVPVKHSIYLSFDNFEDLADESIILPCTVHQPYIEIMYGIQSKVTVHRFCRFKELTNISIPFHTVKIVIFTGVSSSKETINLKEKKGFSISYKAIPDDEEFGSPRKVVLVSLLGLIFVTGMVVCRYMQKHKMCDCCLPKVVNPLQEVNKVQDKGDKNETEIVRQHNVYRDVEMDRKGLNSSAGFSYNTPRIGKVTHKTPSSPGLPKQITQIALQNFSSGKQPEGARWRAEQEALQRHSADRDPNRLSVAMPIFQNSVNRDRITREIGTQEQRREEPGNESYFSIVSSFFA